MSDAFHRKCPLCGGEMLRSRSQHVRLHVLLLEEALEDGPLLVGRREGLSRGPAWAAASCCSTSTGCRPSRRSTGSARDSRAARRRVPGDRSSLDRDRLPRRQPPVARGDRGRALRGRARRGAQQDQRVPGARRRHRHQRRLDPPEDRGRHRARSASATSARCRRRSPTRPSAARAATPGRSSPSSSAASPRACPTRRA